MSSTDPHDGDLSTSVTCFLSSAGSDRELALDVTSILTKLGVTVRTVDDVQPGPDFGTSIVDAVLSAAFVCIILPDSPPPSALMYEAGVAAGSRRPILVIASPEGADQIPANLLSAPIIRYKEGSKSLLRNNITAYLENVHPIAAQLTLNWNVLVDEEKKRPVDLKIGNEHSVVGQIASRLKFIGAMVATEQRIGDGRVDVVATVPSLGDSFNPIFIEVKQRETSPDSDLRQMRNYLRSAANRLGLIVYIKSPNKKRSRIVDSTGILLITYDELMSWTGNHMVLELTKLRNQVVHSA